MKTKYEELTRKSKDAIEEDEIVCRIEDAQADAMANVVSLRRSAIEAKKKANAVRRKYEMGNGHFADVCQAEYEKTKADDALAVAERIMSEYFAPAEA